MCFQNAYIFARTYDTHIIHRLHTMLVGKPWRNCAGNPFAARYRSSSVGGLKFDPTPKPSKTNLLLVIDPYVFHKCVFSIPNFGGLNQQLFLSCEDWNPLATRSGRQITSSASAVVRLWERPGQSGTPKKWLEIIEDVPQYTRHHKTQQI